MLNVTDLVDIVTRYDVVEHAVEIIQHLDHLYRTTFRRQLCKSDNIGEVDRRARIHLWINTASSFQFVRHVTIKQRNTRRCVPLSTAACCDIISW